MFPGESSDNSSVCSLTLFKLLIRSAADAALRCRNRPAKTTQQLGTCKGAPGRRVSMDKRRWHILLQIPSCCVVVVDPLGRRGGHASNRPNQKLEISCDLQRLL